jgi:hypothetical protein
MDKFPVELLSIKSYLKPDSRSWYLSSIDRVSIFLDDTIKNDLNSKGLQLVEDLVKFHDENKQAFLPEKQVKDHSILRTRTGSWFADETHPLHDNSCCNALCTFDNFVLSCTTFAKPIQTSVVVLLIPGKVALTVTGSVYDLTNSTKTPVWSFL